MPVEGEGSNEQNPQQQQSQQQQQQHQHLVSQDLNFSLNDILSNNHHDVNDSSFQSIVQTLSNNNNEQHITPSYAHLPAELQDLLSNETDDLLSTQGNNSDASILHGDMTHLWNQQPQQQSFMASPQNNKPSPSHSTSNISTPNISTPQHQTPPPLPQQQQQQQQQQQPATSTTLLDNITAQLAPDKKDRFIHLFRELQSSNVTANDFLTQAKSLLGQQQYQQLEDLKNKPAQIAQKPPTSGGPIRTAVPVDDGSRKRALTSSQIRAEDAQRSMPGIITPQLKRPKTENIPLSLHQQPMQFPPPTLQQQEQMHQLQMSLQHQHMQALQQQQLQQQQRQQHMQQIPMSSPQQPITPQQPLIPQQQPITPQQSSAPISIAQPPNTQAVFKTPAVPATPGLQIPSKANTPQITSKPAPTNTAAASSSGGGGDRIDYDTLTDVMGYTGVDLSKEESELFMGNAETVGGSLPDGVDRSKMQDFMNTEMLRARILKYAKCVDIKEIDGDFVSYLALAAQDRIRTVMESMVSASKHRTYNPFKKPPMTPEGHPMFKIQVKQNVKLQLETIERVARQTELDLDPPMEEDDLEPLTNEKGWFSNKSRKPLVGESKEKRKITVQDAIFVMERDVQGGRGTNQKALLRAYNEYLS